jgi:hypothetical protein
MKEYKNPYTRQMLDILKPLVGELMAVSIIKTQSAKICIDEEHINIANLPILAEGVRKGLVVFIGSDNAQQVGAKVLKIK